MQLSGLALLVLGIWIVADPSVEANLHVMEDANAGLIMTKYLAFALIAIGGLVFLIGFLGCCGALKENKCLLGKFLSKPLNMYNVTQVTIITIRIVPVFS